jgi:hypothetical protein
VLPNARRICPEPASRTPAPNQGGGFSSASRRVIYMDAWPPSSPGRFCPASLLLPRSAAESELLGRWCCTTELRSRVTKAGEL